jgi:hypothetical protein
MLYFMTIWYISMSFGIFCGHWVRFSLFGLFYPEESGNPVFSDDDAKKNVFSEVSENRPLKLCGILCSTKLEQVGSFKRRTLLSTLKK